MTRQNRTILIIIAVLMGVAAAIIALIGAAIPFIWVAVFFLLMIAMVALVLSQRREPMTRRTQTILLIIAVLLGAPTAITALIRQDITGPSSVISFLQLVVVALLIFSQRRR
jgi:drug/metabolite transporter (DMT)-like permease